MTDRRKPGITFWATVVAVCLPLLYVGSYITLVDVQCSAWPFPMTVVTYRLPGGCEAFQSAWWQQVFVPLNALDRKVRREKWAANPWK